MCIAISKPKGMIINEPVLEKCFQSNSDGAGFAYCEDGILHIEKGFFTIEDFKEAYKPHEEKEALIHFRIKTHGELSAENCHPFMVTDTIAMIHNGIISGHGVGTRSDTACFVDEIIKPAIENCGEDVLSQEWFRTMVEKYIGGSKLMFLDSITGIPIIYNENLCNTNSKVIFSNFSWQPYVPPKKQSKVWDGETPYWNQTTPMKPQYELPKYIREAVESVKNYSGDEFRVAELATLKWDTALVGNKGDVVMIENCWSNNTVDIFNMDATMSVLNVGVYSLAPCEDKDLQCQPH